VARRASSTSVATASSLPAASACRRRHSGISSSRPTTATGCRERRASSASATPLGRLAAGEGSRSTTSWISSDRTVMATGWSGRRWVFTFATPLRGLAPRIGISSTTSWASPNSSGTLLAGRATVVFAYATPLAGSLGGVPLGAPIKASRQPRGGGTGWLARRRGLPVRRRPIRGSGVGRLTARSSASHPPRQRGTGLPRAMVARFDWDAANFGNLAGQHLNARW